MWRISTYHYWKCWNPFQWKLIKRNCNKIKLWKAYTYMTSKSPHLYIISARKEEQNILHLISKILMEIRSSEVRKKRNFQTSWGDNSHHCFSYFSIPSFPFPSSTAATCLKELLYVIKERKNLLWKADSNVNIYTACSLIQYRMGYLQLNFSFVIWICKYA